MSNTPLTIVPALAEERDQRARPGPTPLDRLLYCLDTQDEVTMAGPAGTGKTWHLQHLLNRRGLLLCAPTAKAKERVKEVCNFPAHTVHSLFFGAPQERWQKADGTFCKGWVEQIACSNCAGVGSYEILVSQPTPEWAGPEFPADRQEDPAPVALFPVAAPVLPTTRTCSTCNGIGTVPLKHPAPGCPGCACKSELVFHETRDLDDLELLVVDESSMVGAGMAAAIRHSVDEVRKVSRNRVVILWSGDPGQLPPVEDDPGVDLQNPDIMLEKVYRNDGGILDLATRIRTSANFTEMELALKAHYADVEFRTDGVGGLSEWRAGKSRRMAIVHTNRQRVAANSWVRDTLKRAGPLTRGDRILVRKNMRSVPCWNGEVYVVQSTERVGEDFTIVRAVLDGMRNPPTVRFVVAEAYLDALELSEFGRNTPALSKAFRPLAAISHHDDCTFNTGIFDDDCSPKCQPGLLTGLHLVNVQHGFVITCHASQGSEADEVGVLWTPRSHARSSFPEARSWLYTAVTRARKSLVVWTE